jgi:hypothetical protein
MNYTSMNTSPSPVPVLIQLSTNNNESLTELGIFISSLLLSLGGCIAVCFTALRNSRCREINICGLGNCIRDVPPSIDDV